MKKDHWLYLATAACGAAIWVAIAAASGRREAWDSELYFSTGMPLVCLASLAAGYFEPRQCWRWGVTPFAGQFAAVLVTQGPGSLLPLGVIVFGVLSIPSVITAWIGAWAGRRVAGAPPANRNE